MDSGLEQIIKNINWGPFLIADYFIIEWIVNDSIRKQDKSSYSLIKDKNPLKDKEEINLSPELKIKYRKIDFKELLNLEFGNTVSKFAQIIIDNFSSKNLVNFYNNINELFIKNKSKFDKKDFINEIILRLSGGYSNVSTYSSTLNKISITEENQEISLPHELFHMASCFYDTINNIVFIGFSQTMDVGKKYKKIGQGLNEGYTDYMVEKYYGKNYVEDSTMNYQMLRLLAEQVEYIIGKDKMESLYLNSNLRGLIEELSIYIGEKNAIEFINCTDYLFENINYKNKTKEEEEELLKQLKNLNNFIILLGTYSAIKKFKTGKIEKEKMCDILNKNIHFLPSIMIREKEYKATPDKDSLNFIVLTILNQNGIEFATTSKKII